MSINGSEILEQLGVAQGSFPFVWQGKSKGHLWLLALVSEDLRLAIGSGSEVVGGGEVAGKGGVEDPSAACGLCVGGKYG